jgi:hypothetical protein
VRFIRHRWPLSRTMPGLGRSRVAIRCSRVVLPEPDEFVFRFNRRRPASRGLVFYRVLELAAGHEPVRYHDIVAGKRPRRIPPAPPVARGHPPSLERPPAERPWRARRPRLLRLNGDPQRPLCTPAVTEDWPFRAVQNGGSRSLFEVTVGYGIRSIRCPWLPRTPPGSFWARQAEFALGSQFLLGGASDVGGNDVGGVPVQAGANPLWWSGDRREKRLRAHREADPAQRRGHRCHAASRRGTPLWPGSHWCRGGWM